MNIKLVYQLPQALKNQYLRPENLRTLQVKRLKYMVEHAYKNTSFYKEKFRKAGITPHDIHDLSDLQKIPLSTKEDMRQSPQEVVASGYDDKNSEVHYTSGTSGAMLKILYDRENHSYENAITCRYHFGMGVRPWHKYFMICHDPVEIEQSQKRSLFYRKIAVPGTLSEEEKARLAHSCRPHVMGGHLSTFVAMAKVMENENLSFYPGILIIGGELSLSAHRNYVEKVFHCQTFDKYGAFEAKSIAWECRDHRMHMDADSVIVEFLKDGEPVSPGERGEVVITHLWNKAMPFIRYRLNDIGIPSDEVCTCGRTLPVMKVIEGRADDFLVLPSGRILPPTSIVPLFLTTPHIKDFKIIQSKKDTIKIKIIPYRTYTEEVEKKIIKNMEYALREPVHIDVEKVETIEQESAKYRAVVSKVGFEFSSSRNQDSIDSG